MTTIRDLARLANVSVPTVSRVLNGQPVDSEMTERVLRVARELNYVPNRSARRLRGAGGRLIGAIFSDISNPFYTRLLRAVEKEFADQDATLIVANSDADVAREAKLVRIMLEEGVSGLVIAPADESPDTLSSVVAGGFPVVVVDRAMQNLDVDTVHSRNFEAVVVAVEHLARLGHKDIAFIGGPHRLSSARQRHSGYLAGLQNAGIEPRADLTVFGDYRMDSGRELAARLLDLGNPPSAMLVANNEMVIGALNYIHSIGKVIPDDIAIVGFDDFPWSMSLNPPLTTISQPVDELGRRAARLLIDRLADPARPARTETLDTQLVVRASCGANAQGNVHHSNRKGRFGNV